MASKNSGKHDKLTAASESNTETHGKGVDRRSFLKVLGVAGVGVIEADVAAQSPPPARTYREPVGVLVDTTRCIGCRTCEFVCAEANGLPKPDTDRRVLEGERTTSETQWTVVNRHETDAGNVYVKRQCMHCLQPACASACLTNAMHKTSEGPVVWRESKCMGCRFCMVSCPFDMPKFEYDSPVPKIQKCHLCWERLQEGRQPACVEKCPMKALVFGKRSELIEEAQRRIHEHPDKYVHGIYGEHEVGGTSWLYLSAAPFEQLGFRTDLGTTAYPALTQGFLYTVPVVLTLAPAFLLALRKATERDEEDTEEATP